MPAPQQAQPWPRLPQLYVQEVEEMEAAEEEDDQVHRLSLLYRRLSPAALDKYRYVLFLDQHHFLLRRP